MKKSSYTMVIYFIKRNKIIIKGVVAHSEVKVLKE